MKPRIKSMIWNIRKQKATNKTNKKKKEFKKCSLKTSIVCIIEVPEGEEKKQEIGNLFEKIVKENFPNLVKEIDM